MTKWRHVHSMDTRKVAAANELRRSVGLADGQGRVTLMEYDPETGTVRGKILKPMTDDQRLAFKAACEERGYNPRRIPRQWGDSITSTVVCPFMKSTEGEPVWRPRVDGSGNYHTRADDDGVCRCRGYKTGDFCHLHGLKP